MPVSRRSLTIAVGLALGATAAAAAPTVGPANGGATLPSGISCPTPDADKCKSDGYLDSICGVHHRAICQPIALEAMEDFYKKKDRPTVKMLRPKMYEMPRDIEPGKYFKYVHPPQTEAGHTEFRSVYRKVGDPIRGLQGMDMSQHPPTARTESVDPNVAKEYHRKPEWDEGLWASHVHDCDEYAYERNYGITRFIDRASACKGDFECVFDLAYMPGAVGISERVLRTKDGNPLQQTIKFVPTGPRPKNEMFVHGGAFVRSAGLKALPGVTVVTALETAMNTGKEYYKIGSCGAGGCTAPRKFKNEWTWHKFLHDNVEGDSDAENEEMLRRLAEFRNLLEQWNAAVAWEGSLLNGLPEDEQVRVFPLDMRASNPFEHINVEQEYIERGRDTLQSLKQKFGNSVVNKSIPQIRNLAKAAQHGARSSVLPAGMLAAPVAQPAGGSTTPHGAAVGHHGGATFHSTTGPDTISKCLLPPDELGLESDYKGPISCRIGEFLRAEWKRKQDGHRSCLDLNEYGCDWTPQMFQAAVLDQLPGLDQQVADRAFCRAWDTATTFKNPDAPQKEVWKRLDETRIAYGNSKALIGPYRKGNVDRGRALGKDWSGGDYLGNKQLFAVGYDYDIGWETRPQNRTEAGTNGFVCEVAGSAHLDTGFDAWIRTNKVPVVDGQVAARANEGGDGEIRFKAHLEMFDMTVFTTGRDNKNKLKWRVAQPFDDAPQSGAMIQVPSFKPRFDVYVGVPISGEVWGELLFGSSLELNGSASTNCNDVLPKFAISAGYGPMFGAWGLGQVGVGISGIASAGIRASLNLIFLHLPAKFGMSTVEREVTQNNKAPYLHFGSELGLTLATLAGRISLYVEFFTYDEEFELFRWKGFGPTTTRLMPLMEGDVPLIALDRE
jgi:hypothetical protein